MSRFWKAASAGIGYRYFNIPKNWFIIYLFICWNLMMMKNSFCGMIDQWKAFSLNSNQDHCQRFSLSQIFEALQAEFEPNSELWVQALLNEDVQLLEPPITASLNTQSVPNGIITGECFKISVKIIPPKYYRCYYI